MKKNLIKIISSVLIFTLLLSVFGVFSFADEASVSTGDSGVKLLVNRTYDEGWSYANGFSTVGKNDYLIEYEEEGKTGYNYFTRVVSKAIEIAYFEFKYGNNAPKAGNSILEFDIKIDDNTNIGNIVNINAEGKIFPVVGIKDNNLYVIKPGSYSADTATTGFYVGGLGEQWIHLAFVFTVNQRRCPNCSKVHTLSETQSSSAVICCEGDGGVEVDKMDMLVGLKLYFSGKDTFDFDNAINAVNSGGEKDLSKTYFIKVGLDGASTLDAFRFGTPNVAGHVGMSYLLDNIKVYNNASSPVSFPEGEYGENVNVDEAKTENIISSTTNKTALQYIDEGLVMKVGSPKCLEKNVKLDILSSNGKAYGAPVKIDGEVFVPLEAILRWIGYPMYTHEDGKSIDISTENGSTLVTIGRNTATVNGKLINLTAAPGYATDAESKEQYVVIAMKDVEKIFTGYHVTYDDMGLICISTGANLFNRQNRSDVNIMLDVLKRFIYETPIDGAADVPGNAYYSGVKEFTNSFTHPYLIATQADFDNLNAAYKAAEGSEGYDANLKAYINSVLAEADAIYAEYANETPTDGLGYKYLKDDVLNPYAEEENNDYSMQSGRLDEAALYNAKIRILALAQQITRDPGSKYAHLAYEFAVSMGKWQHWGPAYFVNCADATAAYAMAYDWLYNDWKVLGYDLSVIETALYTKGVAPGYRASAGIGLTTDEERNEANLSNYVDKTTTWNVISTSGMVIGSLALLGIEDVTAAEGRYDNGYADYANAAKYLLKNNIDALIDHGLDIYAPDGSLIEGADYWSYATGALTTMSLSLKSAIGSDFGIMDAAGVDQGFYFAVNTEFNSYGDFVGSVTDEEGVVTEFDYAASNGYHKWNYHGSWNQYANTDMFFFAAEIYDDANLAALRLKQLGRKSSTIWDLLGYNASFAALDPNGVKLELDYVFYNLEGVASRSDAEDGIYVGLMGNANDAEHAQMDSGNFIYANKNFTWFTDFGQENAGVSEGDNAAYRYKYYLNGAEGSNTLFVTEVTAMPYGQLQEGGGTLTEYYNNEYGMYAIIDNSSVYSGSIVSSANRALLFTNDRSTVVIQDQLIAKSVIHYVWIAHTGVSENITLSEDGRTAYLKERINGEYVWIRVSIVNDQPEMKFSVGNCYNTYLDCYKSDYSTNAGKTPERDRSMYQTLTIEWEGIDFNAAIVIEEIENGESTLPVQYSYKSIYDWSPELVSETYTRPEGSTIDNARLDHILVNGQLAYELCYNGSAFNLRTEEFFYNAVYAYNAIAQYGHTNVMKKEHKEMKKDFESVCMEQYKLFRNDMNTIARIGTTIGTYLTGYYYG